MIIPEKHNDPQKKYVSGMVTFLVCVSGYLALAYTGVPEVESTRVYMREISELNITRITTPPETEIREERDQPQEADEAPEEVEVAAEAPRRINLDEVMPEGLRVDLTIDRSERQPVRQQVPESEPRSLRIEDTEIERLEGGMRTLADRSIASRRANRRTPGDPNEGAGIAAEEGLELSGINGGGIVTGTGTTLSGPRGREGSEIGIEVGLRDLDEFGEDYSELDYNAIVEWMKDNPADLPNAVRRLMCDGPCDPSFLTSRVPFHIADRQFDLLLMVIEQNVEVHIFLVEDFEATYLTDSRFREISNRLRRGGVDYLENEIVQVDSQMQPANRERTEEFYGIFLSWWQGVKDEYEN